MLCTVYICYKYNNATERNNCMFIDDTQQRILRYFSLYKGIYQNDLDNNFLWINNEKLFMCEAKKIFYMYIYQIVYIEKYYVMVKFYRHIIY